jgi:hypothetical protein
MGANGRLDSTTTFAIPGTAYAIYGRFLFAGAAPSPISGSGSLALTMDQLVQNSNTTNVQQTIVKASGLAGLAFAAGSADTTTDQTMAFAGYLTNAADYIVFKTMNVKLSR